MILLLGGKGSIGKRYQAILKMMNEPFEIYDELEMPSSQKVGYWRNKYSHYIIVTPTETHGTYAQILDQHQKPYLIEKPLTKNLLEAKLLSERCRTGFVVNNYEFVFFPSKSVSYNFYNTGRDGILFDMCQLIYLCSRHKVNLTVRKASPFWKLHLDNLEVPYRFIEESYFHMIRAFLDGEKERLWTVQQGAEMTRIVRKLEDHFGGEDISEGFNFDFSQK